LAAKYLDPIDYFVEGVLSLISWIIVTPSVGGGNDLTLKIGALKSRGEFDKIKSTILKQLAYISVWGIIAIGICYLFPEEIASIFHGDTAYETEQIIKKLTFMLPIKAVISLIDLWRNIARAPYAFEEPFETRLLCGGKITPTRHVALTSLFWMPFMSLGMNAIIATTEIIPFNLLTMELVYCLMGLLPCFATNLHTVPQAQHKKQNQRETAKHSIAFNVL
jgi:hypothetical protein